MSQWTSKTPFHESLFKGLSFKISKILLLSSMIYTQGLGLGVWLGKLLSDSSTLNVKLYLCNHSILQQQGRKRKCFKQTNKQTKTERDIRRLGVAWMCLFCSQIMTWKTQFGLKKPFYNFHLFPSWHQQLMARTTSIFWCIHISWDPEG